MDWLELLKIDRNPELFWALLVAAATLVLCLVLGLSARARRRRKWRQSREERTLRLYERYTSPETYLMVLAPMMGVSLKWRLLPEQARREFRGAVRAAWAGASEGSPESIKGFARAPNPAGDFLLDHYWTLRPTGGFSEHHSLAAYLQFWVTIDKLRRAKFLDATLCRILFSGHYLIHWRFIAQLREDVKQNLSDADIEPEWIKATERLDTFLI